MKKEIKRSEELYIEFTPEELESLNVKEGDKLSWKIQDDGILLEKMSSMEIEISQFSREVLEFLVTKSIEEDIGVNDVIVNCIKSFLKSDENI
jgi:hypothetical protein